MAPDMAVTVGGLAMRNPFTVASGTFGSGREYAALWASRPELVCPIPGKPLSCLGALTTKGVSPQPWAGNDGCRMAETASGVLNAIGLQNPGVEDFCAHDLGWLADQGTPVIVNVCGHSLDQYVQVVERLEESPAAAYEINISCPNVDCGGLSFGVDPKLAAKVVAACRAATRRPLIVKLTPNVTAIADIARAAAEAGADALSLINTVAGLAVDVRRRRLVFDRGVAGLSGPAVKPIALHAVHRVHQAVALPLIGLGGIACLDDVLEFLLAGATAVGVGTANFTDPVIVPRLVGELERWCLDNGVKAVGELTGAAG
ncbi:MAG: dihydroorotate dehydrogenase [Propionibacteriaceae bacterium]|nr:dihydroorotate dehydrogenase [Propionibacteriaceae bacterium]